MLQSSLVACPLFRDNNILSIYMGLPQQLKLKETQKINTSFCF